MILNHVYRFHEHPAFETTTQACVPVLCEDFMSLRPGPEFKKSPSIPISLARIAAYCQHKILCCSLYTPGELGDLSKLRETAGRDMTVPRPAVSGVQCAQVCTVCTVAVLAAGSVGWKSCSVVHQSQTWTHVSSVLRESCSDKIKHLAKSLNQEKKLSDI